MRYSPKVMRSIFGQMDADNANIRTIAFEKARSTLAADGVTFIGLFEAYERCRAIDEAAARATTGSDQAATTSSRPSPTKPPPPPPSPEPTASSRRNETDAGAKAKERSTDPVGGGPDFSRRADGDPHTRANGLAKTLHARRVWFFTIRSEGRRIVRDTVPPRDTVGILRILKDRIIGEGVYGPRHSMTLSFEADDILYEPFIVTGEKPGWVRQMHRLSTTGDEIIW